MSDTAHSLVDPFDCDDLAFALGVEWEMFRQRIKSGRPFTELCLSDNAVRLSAMAERHGRFSEWHPSDTAGWAVITVGGLIP